MPCVMAQPITVQDRRKSPFPLTIKLTVQPIFLFSDSSPFMQSLERGVQVSVPWLEALPLGQHIELQC